MNIRAEKKGAFQSVVLENKNLKIALLPELGGKIAELRWKPENFEFAAQPGKNYRKPDFGSDFSLFDASGLDDGFPCLHAGTDTVSGYDYPDHGEIWSACFSVRQEAEGVFFTYESPRFPYRYEKKISLTENNVTLTYHIENTGDKSFPCIWAFHGLMRYEENMEILYPQGVNTFLNTFESSLLGAPGRLHSPGGVYDFGKVPPKEPPSMVKYYLKEPVKKGRCGFWYPDPGVGCLLHYDPTALPYLGVWITAGGFRGDYNCALEPANGFYDDIETARRNDALYLLESGRPLCFTLEVEITDCKEAFSEM